MAGSKGGSGSGYDVAPQKLRESSSAFDCAAEDWATLSKTMAGWKLQPHDLGIIGDECDIINQYNKALDDISKKTRQGAANLGDAGTELNNAAQAYEQQDEITVSTFDAINRALG